MNASPAAWLARLTPRQRQFATLGLLVTGMVGALWIVFAMTASPVPRAARPVAGGTPVNLDVQPAGSAVTAVDQWVGTAGRKLAQYEQERDDQQRQNQERKQFEEQTLARFAALEQSLTAAHRAAPALPPAVASPPALPAGPGTPTGLPAALPPPVPRRAPPDAPAMPPGLPPTFPADAPAEGARAPARDPALAHIALAPASPATAAGSAPAGAAAPGGFLPVSFTRGILLGGLDAPTGGQAQANPHPVLIRLADTTVLPNRYRADYRECFVIAAGYGDIGAERAYLRTESLSCVRGDGTTLEVALQGSVYGEDGKVGMRGRLVTKQGQMLANALLAGVASGLGQGVASAATTVNTTPFGAVASAAGSEAARAGLGNGVGHALDRLAQYYIKLAEQTFPVIEIDAGRTIDVVITKGVRLDAPAAIPAAAAAPSPEGESHGTD